MIFHLVLILKVKPGVNFIFSVIETMSEPLEQAVDETLESNFKKLEQKFDSNQDVTDYTVEQGNNNINFTVPITKMDLLIRQSMPCLQS